MSKIINYGIYCDLIDKYVEYKRSLGYTMDRQLYKLRQFDQLTIDRGENTIGISKELMDEWCKPRPNEAEITRYLRISAIKGFSAYLQILGYESYIPKLPKFHSNFKPYVYTQKEMTAIFRECDKLHSTNRMGCPVHIMPTLVRMLYGTGIRIGEALKLCHGDINLDVGALLLKGCKNGQDRIVPMSPSLIGTCKDYIAYKEKIGLEVTPESKFFVARNGNICKDVINSYFRKALFNAGIKSDSRIHSLRHTMASNALAKMSASGLDLYYSLPILMTYLGHKSLRATNHYVRITKELYPNLLKKVNEIANYVFPEFELDYEEEL